MSRVGDYDDYDDGDPQAVLNYGRWQRNSRAVLTSKRGQKALRDIEAALLALPEPRLAYETFHKVEGDKVECCVLGAVARARGVEPPEWLNGEDFKWRDTVDHEPASPEDTAFWAEKNLGLAFTLAYNLMDLNDRDVGVGDETPEGRYERILAFVRKHIRPADNESTQDGGS